MDKRKWIDEHYGHRVVDGDSIQGSIQCGCYRNETTGTIPSSGRCCLNVRREGNSLLYNCLSAGCDIGGGSAGSRRNGLGHSMGISTSQRTVSDISDFGRVLPTNATDWLQTRDIGIDRAMCEGVRYDKSRQRLVFPVESCGESYGFISRDFNGTSKYKWFKEGAVGGISSHSGDGHTAYIVESIVSAIRLNILLGVPTIAILGTAMPESKINNITKFVRQEGITEAKLWLDPDVPREKRRKLQKLLTSRCVPTTLLINNNKPHNIPKEELIPLLGERK